MESLSLTKFYKTDESSEPIYLEVVIGYAQKAFSRLFLGGKKLGSEKTDSFTQKIGINKNLKNERLDCAITVHDIQKITNETSVTLKLTGGQGELFETLNKSVNSEGDVVFYIATIYFN